MKKLLTLIPLLVFGNVLSSKAVAQTDFKTSYEKLRPINPISFNNNPEALQSRFVAVASSWHDGLSMKKEDSTYLFYSGQNHDNHVVNIFVEYLFEQYNPQLYFEDPMITPSADSLYMHNWSNGANTYTLTDKTINDFNNEGLLETETEYYQDGNNWEPSFKTNYVYNTNNQITQLKTETWNGNNWENSELTEYQYDNNENLIEELEKSWNNGNWENSQINEYEYDNNGNITQISVQLWDANNWYDVWRLKVTYNNNLVESEIQQLWNDYSNEWENIEKFTYEYDSNERRISDIQWEWDGLDWIEETKDTYIYNNGINDSRKTETYYNNSWNNYLEYHYSFIGENLTSAILKVWNGNEFEEMSKFEFNYNNFDQITEINNKDFINSDWSYGPGNFILKFYYEEYDGVSVDEYLANDEYIIYPNPAKDVIKVKMNQQNIQNVQITDITGKIVFENKSSINANEISIPVNHLTNGIYFINIESNGQRGTKSILIQH